MPRLIDADALKSFVCEFCNSINSEEPCEPADCRCMSLIDEMPTVDAVEVVHGRWEKRNKNIWQCSVCKRGVPYSYTGFHYCPNCGAKMDGDGNEID